MKTKEERTVETQVYNMLLKKRKFKSMVSLTAATAGQLGVVPLMLAPVTPVFAETTGQTAENYDLTKQATTAPFPVMFDRPSGINVASLASAVRGLGANSELYKSALSAIPELGNTAKMARLLSDTLSEDATTNKTARETIVKLINWYNGLGGTQIKTQKGEAYTIANLDEPINVLAVGFANGKTKEADAFIQSKFGAIKTSGDAMKVLESFDADSTKDFKSAFAAYKTKVEMDGADIAKLSEYAAVKPVLDGYEGMYNKASGSIKEVISKSVGTQDAGVAFFESAVITGRMDKVENKSTEKLAEKPAEKKLTTKFIDEAGKELAASVEGASYVEAKAIDGYQLVESRTENNVRSFTYRAKGTAVTKWVDEVGTELKASQNGTFPDSDGKSDIDGYVFVGSKSEKDDKGNTITVNTYKKASTDSKPDTYWFDESGNSLKDKVTGEALLDADGQSDIDGYKLVRSHTLTAEDLAGTFKGSNFKVGDVLNVYEKASDKPVVPQDKPNEKQLDASKGLTNWVDETGKKLKDTAEGSHPDNDGKTDVDGYELLRTVTDSKGNVTNIYQKQKTTVWVDENGKELQESKAGAHPDNDGKSDIPGYKLVKTEVDRDGSVKNTYTAIPKITTSWIDTEGKELKAKVEGSFPDSDDKSDIDGYALVTTETDKDGNVVNKYKALHTSWVDEEGKELKEKALGAFPDSDEKSDIEGYVLVKTDTDKDGNVVNTYKKAHTPVTRWIDLDGKDLQASAEGAKPDNDGQTDIKGYKWIRTMTAENGDVTNVYEKEATEVLTHWVDEDGIRLTDDQKGNEFGGQKDIDGYVLKDVRTSKDGKAKFYVYTKKADAPKPKALPETGDAAGAILGLSGVGSFVSGALLFFRKRRG